MRKFHKRMLLVFSALVLVLALGLPVFAAGADVPESVPASSDIEGTEMPAAGTGDESEPSGSVSEPDASSEESPSPEDAGSEDSGNQEENTPEQPGETQPPEEETDESQPELPDEPEEAEEEEADAEQAEGVESYGLVLDENSIVVETYSELKKALGEDNGFTTIYLGANISAENASGVPIHPGKTVVVIDGTPPGGGRYTFTQYAGSVTGNTFLVNNAGAATTDIVLRNMDVVGRNLYGLVWVLDSLRNVTITLEDVAYTGPQALNHRFGTVRLIGGSYTGTTEEIAEALHVELGGTLSIQGPSTAGISVFWMTGGAAASTITVLENANVTVDANNYFVYGSLAAATLQTGASFNLTSRRFGFTYAADSVGNFTMAEGSQLYIDLNTTESYAALRVSKRFEMAPGSSATLVRTGTDGIPLRLTAAGAQAVFNQPKSVFFYSSASVPMRFTGAGSLSITTSALNVWNSASWPVTGGMDTLPSHIWNKADNGLLTVSGSYTEAANNNLSHNLTAGDPIQTALNASNFNLNANQLLAFGSHSLTIDPLSDKSTVITGGTVSGATLLASHQNGNLTGVADFAGSYSLPLDAKLPVGSDVAVVSRVNNLYVRQKTGVLDAGGRRLQLAAVPETISFGTLAVPGAESLIAPTQEGLRIVVEDSRLNPSPWRLEASLSGPLMAQVGQSQYALPGAIVFSTSATDPLVLNEVPRPIHYQGEAKGGETVLEWGGGEGILLNLVPGEVYSGTEYSATIHWSLVDAP